MSTGSTEVSDTGSGSANVDAGHRLTEARRPLGSQSSSPDLPREVVLLVIDASGSMNDDGKASAVDHTADALIDALARSTERCYSVGAVVFGPGERAAVHREVTPVSELLKWPRLRADGPSPLGAALDLAADLLTTGDFDHLSAVLFTDGFPTDEWQPGLRRLLDMPAPPRRFSIGIGPDAADGVLRAFASLPEENHVLRAEEAVDVPGLIERLGWWTPEGVAHSDYQSIKMPAGDTNT